MDFHAIDEADGPDCWVRYYGRRERVAVFLLGGERITLGFSDTRRCADDADACRETVAALCDTHQVEQVASRLQAHCRQITGWKEKPKRDVQKRGRALRRYI